MCVLQQVRTTRVHFTSQEGKCVCLLFEHNYSMTWLAAVYFSNTCYTSVCDPVLWVSLVLVNVTLLAMVDLICAL